MYDWSAKYSDTTRRTAEQIREQAAYIRIELEQRGPKTAEELAAPNIFNVPCRYLERPLRLLMREQGVRRAGRKRWTKYYIK